MASDSGAHVASLDTLPDEALHAILSLLPVDQRALAACVCPSWRTFLADPSLFQVLDLTPAGGVAAERVTEALLRAFVARAGGELRVLRVNGGGLKLQNPNELLVELIESHGAGLEELSTTCFLHGADVSAICAAAPRLQVLNANLSGGCTRVVPALRSGGPLRVKELSVAFQTAANEDEVLAGAAAVASHESLQRLTVFDVHFPRGLNALVDAAAQRRLPSLMVSDSVVDLDFFLSLSRLLLQGSLTKLEVHCPGFPFVPDVSVPVLCTSLRLCNTLTHLTLLLNPAGGTSAEVVTELLDAVKELPALSMLSLVLSRFQDVAASGRAFGAFLSANMPSLHILRVAFCDLGDEGLAPILDGLAANTHLRELDCATADTTTRARRSSATGCSPRWQSWRHAPSSMPPRAPWHDGGHVSTHVIIPQPGAA